MKADWQWGGQMQGKCEDATTWAINEGIAGPKGYVLWGSFGVSSFDGRSNFKPLKCSLVSLE
ncbi:MAG: hypothetical protein Ct9H300mP20_18900 [Gammaproteobacteria bacterium]|nr:MAG: hypothetical protein Ct9H300mP20_18900 [Gammaproteobacteria bacterium]